MDPSIMKLLEEDEDETMHSGADVDAFTAALNRDIEGDLSTSQPSDSDNALSQGNNHNSSQLFPQWKTSSQDEHANIQSQQDTRGAPQQVQHSSEMELKQHGWVPENQQQQIESSTEMNRLPLQQKQSQVDCQQHQVKQDTFNFSQTSSMHNSEKNPIHTLEQDEMQNHGSESRHPKLQSISQQPTATEQAFNPMNRGKQVPFALLLPVILPQLDRDKAMQLQTLYIKLKKNEVSKDDFVRHMKSLVGDQMLKMAVYKLQAQATRNPQTAPNQFPAQSQASMQQHHLKMPSTSAPQSFAQFHQKGVGFPADSSHIHSSAVQLKTESSSVTMENNAQKPRGVDRELESHGMQVNQMSVSSLTVNPERERTAMPVQGLNKQQQHLHFSQPSFPIHGSTGGNYHSFPGPNANSSVSSFKQQSHDSQKMQVPAHQSMGATQSGTVTQTMNAMTVPKFERPNSIGEPKRVQGGTLSHLANNATLQQNSPHSQTSSSKELKIGAPPGMFVKQEPFDQGTLIPRTSKEDIFEMQSSRMGFSTSSGMVPSTSVTTSLPTQLDPSNSLSSRIPSAASPGNPGNNVKTPPKKPIIGQKKPLDLGSSPPLPSKKPKISGGFLDQSIEQLNDVTAVSGVDLREEEEQLFSGPKEDSRISEASRRVVQEEEEKLILQKIPLQKKLAEIIVKCGVKGVGNDVERCLSLCVEERMRGLISNMVRLSKQRVDIEKPRHRILVTSDVRQQIMVINQKSREEWEKRQSEAEKLLRLNEPEGDTGVDGDKDEGRTKAIKANKEEDDKMRTTAANVAARAAVGGDDMLSKWQLMAEQARQKREGGGGNDVASGSQPGKDVSRKPLSSSSGRNRKDNNQDADKRGHQAATETSGIGRKLGRNGVGGGQTRVARNITIKDVIAILERESQMSKSTMMYRLYDKVRSDASSSSSVAQ